jgi:hypothetical protein
LKIYERNSKSAASSSLFPITQPSIGKPIQMQPMWNKQFPTHWNQLFAIQVALASWNCW